MIIKVPDPKLKQVCTPCNFKEAKSIAKKLMAEAETAAEEQLKHGNVVVGLAAPQIGINKQMFLAMGKVYINPKLYDHAGEIKAREGCLSLKDDEITETTRSKMVKLRWFDVSRKLHTGIFEGNQAVVIQHELDHLRGVMCNEG